MTLTSAKTPLSASVSVSLALTFFLTQALTSSGVAVAADKTVTYASGAEKIKAQLELPKGAGKSDEKRPAVILIHEWWGQNDWVKTKARGFADQGYVALAVDLYRGKTAADPDAAHQLMRGLPEDRALRDLQAAVRY